MLACSQAPRGRALDAMARAGAEAKALFLFVTFFPQCVVSMLRMTSPSSPPWPRSVDLHIGHIYLSGEAARSLPGLVTARNEVTLATAEIALIVTEGRLNMPRNWVAYGFPPSHLARATR
jgi:hypothetical protein